MKTYLSWSGGKDSTASIILCHEKGIPIDRIIFSEVMFDNARNISGEEPEHIKWIYDIAIPTIENKYGYKVLVVRSKNDYISCFYNKCSRSKKPNMNGKFWGFPMGGMCNINSKVKVAAIKETHKIIGNNISIIGIACDEQERIMRMKPNQRSVLNENNKTETDAYLICKDFDLLSPIYEYESRGGCWFCPNKSVRFFARLAKRHPELWAELEKLSHIENLASPNFKYGRTFASVNREVQILNNQISMWEYLCT